MNALRHSDHYMVAADFEAYFEAQRRVDQLWLSSYDWTRASILNTAHMAWFSSDRAIGEYAADIWHVPVAPSPTRSHGSKTRIPEFPPHRWISQGDTGGDYSSRSRHNRQAKLKPNTRSGLCRVGGTGNAT